MESAIEKFQDASLTRTKAFAVTAKMDIPKMEEFAFSLMIFSLQRGKTAKKLTNTAVLNVKMAII